MWHNGVARRRLHSRRIIGRSSVLHCASDSETASILTNRLRPVYTEPRHYFHLWFVATFCCQWLALKFNMHTLWYWNVYEILPLLLPTCTDFTFMRSYVVIGVFTASFVQMTRGQLLTTRSHSTCVLFVLSNNWCGSWWLNLDFQLTKTKTSHRSHKTLSLSGQTLDYVIP